MQWVIVASLVALAAVNVRGFGGGAPSGACMDHLPRHQGLKRNGPPHPYNITVTPSEGPGRDFQVNIIGYGATFKGYMLQAVHVGTNKIVGTFKGTGLVTCGSRANTATHQTGVDKQTETFTWTPEEALPGFVSIRGTVLERYDNAYVNVYSNEFTVNKVL